MNGLGHTTSGWAVEFNLEAICACETLTVETRAEAKALRDRLQNRDYIDSTEVVSR